MHFNGPQFELIILSMSVGSRNINIFRVEHHQKSFEFLSVCSPAYLPYMVHTQTTPSPKTKNPKSLNETSKGWAPPSAWHLRIWHVASRRGNHLASQWPTSTWLAFLLTSRKPLLFLFFFLLLQNCCRICRRICVVVVEFCCRKSLVVFFFVSVFLD